MKHSLALGGALCAAVFALASTAHAEDWIELPFAPKIGSHWIATKLRNDTTTQWQGDQKVSEQIIWNAKAELVYEEKTATGYVVSYVHHGTKISGASPKAMSLRSIMPLLDNVVMRASVDQNGVPLQIENLGEVQGATRAALDRLTAGKDPETAGAIRRLTEGMFNADAKAAVSNLSDIQWLALAQNTGLKTGEVRHSFHTDDSGFGGLVSNRELSILKTDAAAKTVTILIVETVDPVSLHKMMAEVVSKSAQPGEDVSGRIRDLNAADISIVNRYEIDVVDGMGREMREESTTSRKFGAYSSLNKDVTTVTLTPAP